MELAPTEFIKKQYEDMVVFVRWIAAIWRSKDWVRRLVLIGFGLYFALNPYQKLFPTLLKFVPQLQKSSWYEPAFWLLIIITFAGAVIVAARAIDVRPAPPPPDRRSPVKGLLAFDEADEEVFARLQRDKELFECAQNITDRNFRFGILSADSGNGKTSFLQAGLLPVLRKRGHRCVYVEFSGFDPIVSIRQALAGRPTPDTPPDATLSELLRSAARPEDKGAGPLVLLLDQFEQFFVHQKRKKDREPFIRQLSEWYNSDSATQAKLLISIRSEFRGRLDEIQKAMGLSLGWQQLFTLDRFTPEVAAEIFRVLAESANLEFDQGFIEEMTARELASPDDGLISPVDIQILAWIITLKSAGEERAFTRRAFQKLGGVERLMERFLTLTLEARLAPSQRQAATKVLLALTDLDRNTRAGALTFDDLRRNLRGAVSDTELRETVRWLTSGGVRLAVSVKHDDVERYELAHELLIPALRRIANKELTEADRANLLLDRRANEWQGGNRDKRYLFSRRELRLIDRQTPFLQWGQNRSVKQALIRASNRRSQFHLALATSLILGLLLVNVAARILDTQWGQLQLIKLDVWKSSKSMTDNHVLTQIAKAYATMKDFHSAKGVAEKISDESSKALALGEIARVMAEIGAKPQATDLLKEVRGAAEKINDQFSKANAFGLVAVAMAETGAKQQAMEPLKQAQGAADKISDESSKANVLGEIAKAMAEIGAKQQVMGLLEQALEAADKISDESSKALALGGIARAMAEIGAKQRDEHLLKQALEVAEKISPETLKASTFGRVAVAMTEIGATQQAIAVVNQAHVDTEKIIDKSSKAYALGVLLVAMAEIGAKQRDEHLLKQTPVGLDAISGEPTAKAIAQAGIAKAMAKIGVKQQAIELLNQAWGDAVKISNEEHKALVLVNIAKTAAAVEDFRLARAVASKQVTDARKMVTLASILETWARSKDPGLAGRIWEFGEY